MPGGLARLDRRAARAGDEMDGRIDPIDRELAPLARHRWRAALLRRSRDRAADRPHLRRRDRRGLPLLIAREADRLRRAGSEGEPVGRALGDRRLSRPAPGPCAGRRSRPPTRPGGPPPWHGHYLRISARHGKNPAKSAVARKLLIASWHMLSRGEPFKPRATAGSTPLRRAPRCFLTARRSRMELSGRGSSQERSAPRSAEREMSTPHPPAGSAAREHDGRGRSPPT